MTQPEDEARPIKCLRLTCVSSLTLVFADSIISMCCLKGWGKFGEHQKTDRRTQDFVVTPAVGGHWHPGELFVRGAKNPTLFQPNYSLKSLLTQ